MQAIRMRLFSLLRNCQPLVGTKHARHTLPSLPYDYNSLEPVLCKEIMEMHHKKHHQYYINNLNVIEDSLKECIGHNDARAKECLLYEYESNLGGHINHSLFWKSLTPQKMLIDGELLELINKSFGSLECMKEKMIEAASCFKGAGWVWLGYDRTKQTLRIAKICNEQRLYYTKCLYPLFGIDVWEHAYYLQYLDSRPDYSRAIFDIINWEEVRQRYLDAKCGILKLG